MHPGDRDCRRVSADARDATKSRPLFIIPTAFVLFLVFGLGSNVQLALLACAVLIAGTFLLWRPGEAPILLFVFGFQWLQAAIGIFHANFKGLPIDQFSYQLALPGNAQLATTLSLIGLVFLATGMRLGAGPERPGDAALVLQGVWRQAPIFWVKLWAVAWAVATAAQSLALAMPGLSQPLLALANLKWAFFLILTYATFARPDANKILWLAVFGLEFIAALGGYFSSFRTVFLLAFIGVVASGVRLKPKQILVGAALGVVTLLLGVVWTAVKVEYRTYLSGGERAQIVTVGRAESLQKLLEMTSTLTSDDLSQAADQMAKRVAYTGFFAAALDYVPSIVPHENGALWLDAITRPFMPRLFFPDKAIIDESILTNKYTGLGVAGMEQGTQIGLGYMAESYVDFGEIGMMVPIFLLGLFLGLVYRWITGHKNARGLLGMGLASAVLITADNLGMSTAKLMGALIVQLLVVWALLQFVAPRYLRSLRPLTGDVSREMSGAARHPPRHDSLRL